MDCALFECVSLLSEFRIVILVLAVRRGRVPLAFFFAVFGFPSLEAWLFIIQVFLL